MLCLSKKVSLVGCFECVFFTENPLKLSIFLFTVDFKTSKISGASPLDPANALCVASRHRFAKWGFAPLRHMKLSMI